MGDDAPPFDLEPSAPPEAGLDRTTLIDPWGRPSPIPLNGTLERQQFPPLLTAVLALLLALVLFQLLVTPVVMVALLAARGVALDEALSNIPAFMEEQAPVLITANTIGQLLAIALPAYLLTRLHSARPGAFLRLRMPDVPLLVLSLFGLFALMPVVQWLGMVNEWLPLPEAIREFDRQQMNLVERVLEGDLGITLSLVALAVTPAFCEELLFRGYVQRQAERGLGAAGGILLSGFVFGIYHIRLTQLLPLAALGLYLAYLAWRTGSLWIPIAVHFANNAFAVALGLWASSQPEMDLHDIEQMDVPWYLVLGGPSLPPPWSTACTSAPVACSPRSNDASWGIYPPAGCACEAVPAAARLVWEGGIARVCPLHHPLRPHIHTLYPHSNLDSIRCKYHE